MGLTGYYGSVKKYVIAHKIMSAIVAVVVLGGGYWTYGKLHPATVETRYILSSVATGTIISTVSASGQVSPSNQVTINPKGSGQITQVLVSAGAHVAAGQALAYIDATDAVNAVNDAKANLTSAQIALQKLQKPADALTVTQAQNAIARAQESQTNAQTALTKAYNDGFSAVSDTFVDFPTAMTGLHDILYNSDRSLGGSGQWNVDFYAGAIDKYSPTLQGTQFKNDVIAKYNAAKTAYDKAFADYKVTSSISDPTTIQSLMKETYAALSAASDATKSANNLIQLYKDTLANQNLTPSATADTHVSALNGYTSTITGHQSSILSQINTITSSNQSIVDAKRTIDEDQQSLTKVQSGPDALDVQSANLTIQQRQNALQQAQDTLADYTVRAPFAGTLASFTLHKGDTVGSGTSAGVEITTQDIADLSLNEVDAAKVAIGQKVTLTFDAIPDLTLTGAVAEVSPLGTVTQGVVSYGVKIAFDTQDVRVKAGMSVNADIQTAVHQNVLTVPSSAVKSANGSSYVQVFEPALPDATSTGTQGVTSKTPPRNVSVTVGITDDTNTEITSGLMAGQQIVARTAAATTAKTAASTATSRGGLGGGEVRTQAF